MYRRSLFVCGKRRVVLLFPASTAEERKRRQATRKHEEK